MKRPFDIETFPNVPRVNYTELDFRKTKKYCAIETVTPLSKEDIYKYELKLITKDYLNSLIEDQG